MLTVALRKRLGDFTLDAAWSSDRPVVALVGPSGSGKTLTLQCIAGLIQPDRGQDAVPLHLVDKAGLEDFVKPLSAQQRAALAAQKFEGDGFSHAILPDGDGWSVVAGVADPAGLSSWCLAKLAEVLPAGTYRRADGDAGPAPRRRSVCRTRCRSVRSCGSCHSWGRNAASARTRGSVPKVTRPGRRGRTARRARRASSWSRTPPGPARPRSPPPAAR